MKSSFRHTSKHLMNTFLMESTSDRVNECHKQPVLLLTFLEVCLEVFCEHFGCERIERVMKENTINKHLHKIFFFTRKREDLFHDLRRFLPLPLLVHPGCFSKRQSDNHVWFRQASNVFHENLINIPKLSTIVSIAADC